MNQSPEINALAMALAKAQSKILSAVKDSKNPFFGSKYANLESVWDAIREPLTANGLCVMQTCREDDRGSYLVTTLAHTSGQWMRGEVKLLAAKNDAQGMGAAITYFRRFCLAGMVGVVQSDDDGNTASGRPESPGTEKAPAFKSGEAMALENPGEHKIMFALKDKTGKSYWGQRIDSLDIYMLDNAVQYWAKKGLTEKLGGPAADFVKYGEAYLKTREPGDVDLTPLDTQPEDEFPLPTIEDVPWNEPLEPVVQASKPIPFTKPAPRAKK